MKKREANGQAGEILVGLLGPLWRVEEEPRSPKGAIRLVGPRQAALVTVKSSTQRSSEDVRARIALAVLEVRRDARDAVPIVAVSVANLAENLGEAIAGFMNEVAPDVGWMLFDSTSGLRARVPQLGIDVTRISEPASVRTRPQEALFSDLNRWILKILLLSKSPEAWWGGVRGEPEHPTALARLAGVSVAKAHQFARRFEEQGFLSHTRKKLGLIDVPHLLRAWLDAETVDGGTRRVPCQWPLGGRGDIHALRRSDEVWAFGGFAACVQLQVLHTEAPETPDVHLQDEGAISRVGLVPVRDERDAHLMVRITKHPTSALRGRVGVSGTYHVDVWQAALDVLGQRRGREQAEFVLEQVVRIAS